jgi:MoxR-like ATPase
MAPAAAGAAGSPARSARPTSIDATEALLAAHDYLADRRLATAIFLALTLERPLLLEGEAGVGKTEVAKVLASALDRPLIRLQCYEGLDIASAAWEWDHARQMIEIRLAEAAAAPVARDALAHDLYAERFLLARPLLAALRGAAGRAPVLLIDELDRTDAPFEAYLLEVLSEFQITIPELGTIRAHEPPIVIVTSNRTREIHDALKRRCLYHWLDYPDAARELEIVRRKVPGAGAALSAAIVAFVQGLRATELYKAPGVAETLDWARALLALDRDALDAETVELTLGVLLKGQDDLLAVRGERVHALLAA